MTKIGIIALICLTALTPTAVSAQKMDKKDRRAMAMTIEEAAATVEVTGGDDPLDPTIFFSTIDFNRKNLSGDKFLRAIYDKVSGVARFQVYIILRGSQSFRPERLTYLHEGQLQSADVSRIDFDVDCYRSSCTNIEHAVAAIPEEAFAEFASCAKPGTDAHVRMKLFGANVGGEDAMFFCTEAAGLLLRLQQETGFEILEQSAEQ